MDPTLTACVSLLNVNAGVSAQCQGTMARPGQEGVRDAMCMAVQSGGGVLQGAAAHRR